MSEISQDRFDLLVAHYTNANRFNYRLLDAMKQIEAACDTGDLGKIRQAVEAAKKTPRPPSVLDDPRWKDAIFGYHPYPEYLELPGVEYVPLR